MCAGWHLINALFYKRRNTNIKWALQNSKCVYDIANNRPTSSEIQDGVITTPCVRHCCFIIRHYNFITITDNVRALFDFLCNYSEIKPPESVF